MYKTFILKKISELYIFFKFKSFVSKTVLLRDTFVCINLSFQSLRTIFKNIHTIYLFYNHKFIMYLSNVDVIEIVKLQQNSKTWKNANMEGSMEIVETLETNNNKMTANVVVRCHIICSDLI